MISLRRIFAAAPGRAPMLQPNGAATMQTEIFTTREFDPATSEQVARLRWTGETLGPARRH
jgi:hypothetical protein